MATASSSNIIRCYSRIISNPTPQSALTTGNAPYGGTYLGQTRGFRFMPKPKYRDIWAEEIGSVVDSIYCGEGPCELRCIVRSPDNDMISAAAPRSVAGASQRRWLFRPGGTTSNTRAGTSLYGTAVKLLIAPIADVNMPAILIYNAIPEIAEDAELRYSLAEEYGLGIRFVGTPDSSGRVYDTGRIVDLTL